MDLIGVLISGSLKYIKPRNGIGIVNHLSVCWCRNTYMIELDL